MGTVTHLGQVLKYNNEDSYLYQYRILLVCFGFVVLTHTIYIYYQSSVFWFWCTHTYICVCVFFPFILDVQDVPAGVTQEEGHTGFFIHLLSAVQSFIFLETRRIQPFLSLVDREVEFCVLPIQSVSTRWAFLFLFFSEKNPVCRGRTHVPTCQRVTRYL